MLKGYKRKYICPESDLSFENQLNECLAEIDEIKKRNDILLITFFIRSNNNEEYLGKKRNIFQNIYNLLGQNTPSLSVIGQIPVKGEVSVEMVFVSKEHDLEIQYKQLDGITYTIVDPDKEKEIFAGGIAVEDYIKMTKTSQAEAAFDLMARILMKESMNFSHVVRQWNYVEDITGFENVNGYEVQKYQALNDIRAKYYSTVNFTNGYPAATGIGMNTGGIILEFYANKFIQSEEVQPIKNPQQKDAYAYSQDVLIGHPVNEKTLRSSPKFERAKYLSTRYNRIIFISGTASIKNENTLGINDIETQTKVTIENIENLISQQNLKTNKVLNNFTSVKYSLIRVYVKNTDHLEVVQSLCETSFKGAQINYLIADICRDNLLVEIEGVAELF
ncbi:MAG: hypothetical protein JXB17_09395 [Bacteroidales bacterium]|nr:hypothetical protein [Bacteroidales bacterium]